MRPCASLSSSFARSRRSGWWTRWSRATATVRVNYEGRLLDGTRFDGNLNEEEASFSFPIKVKLKRPIKLL